MDASHWWRACRRVSAAIKSFDAAAAKIGVNRSAEPVGGRSAQPGVSRHGAADHPLVVTTLVDRLEVAGFVRRMTEVHDRRSTLVEVLPATWEAFARVGWPVGERVDHIVEGWDEQQPRVVIQALLQMATVCDEATQLATRPTTHPDSATS